MNKKIGLGTVFINNKGEEYVKEVLKSKRLSYGKFSELFEQQFAAKHNSKYAILTNSGTSSLHIALETLKNKYNWSAKNEIIVPALTFVSTVNAVIQSGLIPRFTDVNKDYFDIDELGIEKAINKNTRAIILVHLFGQAAQAEKIVKIAKKYRLKIIEDACQTMFAKRNGQPVGSFGSFSCFSTYSAHLITTGIGGLLLTSNKGLYKIAQSLINHGRNNSYICLDDDDNLSAKRLKTVINKRFEFNLQGYSYRLGELEAALGLSQLQEYKKIIVPRQKNAAYLSEKLANLSLYLKLPKTRQDSEHVFMVYPIITTNKVSRNELTFYLEKKGIETRPLLPLINQPIYKKYVKPGKYPNAKMLQKKGFYIGCHQDLNVTDLDYIVFVFKQFFKAN